MTQSKQSATNSNSEGPNKVTKEKAIWIEDDELFFITSLLKHKAEAGDGANFKTMTLAAIGQELDKHKESDGHEKKGGSKDANACKSKWIRVRNSEFLS
jgi:hypothetical protein